MSIIKQLKKVAAIMLVVSSVVCVGCSSEKAVSEPTTTPVATEAAESKVELNEVAIETDSFKMNGPKGWNEETESGVIKITNDNHELISAVLVPVPDLDKVDIEEYKEQVIQGFKENTKVPIEMKKIETAKIAGKNAVVIESEMAFTEEYINGWIQAGNLTQEDIDAAGGADKFIETHKVSQIQIQMLAKQGIVTIVGQTITEPEPVKDIVLAAAETIVLK